MTNKTNFSKVTICSEMTTFLVVIAFLAGVFYNKSVNTEAASTEDTYIRTSYIGAASIGGAGGAFITDTCIEVAGIGDDCIGDTSVRDAVAVRNAHFRDASTHRDICFRDIGAVRDTRFKNAGASRDAHFKYASAVNCLGIYSQFSQILELNRCSFVLEGKVKAS